MKEPLEKYIKQWVALSEKETQQFCGLFEKQTIKKKEFLLRVGETCKFEGFVTKGLFRVYHIDQNGAEQILYFAIEDWWITDIDSFTNQRPSQLFIEALEESEVLLISKENKDFALSKHSCYRKTFQNNDSENSCFFATKDDKQYEQDSIRTLS